MKKIPVTIPLNNNGSYSDVVQDFINTMEAVIQDNVEVEVSLKGKVTVYFGADEISQNKNKHPEMNIDFDALYRGDYVKLLDMDVTKPDKV